MSDDAVRITRNFKASPQRVFDAFTNKEAMQSWYGPEGMTVPSIMVDPRPGGKYRIEMHSPEGSAHIVVGEFREVRPPEKLSFTWAWLDGSGTGRETLVTLSFAAKNGGTEMSLVHSGFANADATAAHEHGWGTSLQSLTNMLAGQTKAKTARPTLLGDPRSSFVRSARMAFAEKGIAYELDPQPPHSEAVNQVHPLGKIPALVNGNLRLFESSAIMRYVDEAFPGPRLMPQTPADRALAEQWISSVHCYFYSSMVERYVLQYIFPKGKDGTPDRTVIDQAIVDMKRHFGILDAAYGDRRYLVGEHFSLADLMLAPVVFYVQNMPEGNDILAPFPNVRRAFAAIAERDSFKATAPATNLA